MLLKADKMELETLNLDLICRTCKCVAPEMRSLFEGYENPHQNPRIDEMLMACASVQVVFGDGLPAQICQICVKQLRDAFFFKRQSEKVDASFRNYAKNVKDNEIKEEPQNFDFTGSLNTLSNLLNEHVSVNEICETTSIASVDPKIETDYIQFLDNDQLLLTCYKCAKIFTTIKGLRSHKYTHLRNRYKCSQCDKEYIRLNHLQRHELSHSAVQKKVHVCKICGKTLSRIDRLKRHIATHLREKPFSCNTCNRVFSRVEHLQNHTPRCKRDIVYSCDICNKAFSREDSLEVHKKIHNSQTKLSTIENLDNIEDYYYQIDQDADSFFSEHSDVVDGADMSLNEEDNNLRETVIDNNSVNDIGVAVDKTANNQENEEQIDTTEVKVEDILKIEDNIMEHSAVDIVNDVSGNFNDLDYLPKKSTSPKMKRGRGRPRKNPLTPVKVKIAGRVRSCPLLKRIKTEEMDEKYGEYPCPFCQEMFDSMSALDKHATIRHEGLKVHKCNVCNKQFSRINHLKRHVSSHLNVKPFHCTVCTKSFNRKDYLNQHLKLHERCGDFKCDICEKIFNRTEHLAKHKASKHGTGVKIMSKKYECSLCLKIFMTEKSRDIHIKRHKGQKEYTCKVCEKTLSKSDLMEHMKIHNIEEHSKKFLCSECGQRFSRNDYLVIHMRRHRGEKPFKCKFCGKGFPRTSDLKVHERHHTGEKTHLCTICGRGFGRAYNLTLHMRTHTGEKPYQCTYCDAAFAQGNDLKTHIRRHTGERFQCEICSESFLVGYMLTQHKRTVHGLNVVSNIRHLQPVCKQENSD